MFGWGGDGEGGDEDVLVGEGGLKGLGVGVVDWDYVVDF